MQKLARCSSQHQRSLHQRSLHSDTESPRAIPNWAQPSVPPPVSPVMVPPSTPPPVERIQLRQCDGHADVVVRRQVRGKVADTLPNGTVCDMLQTQGKHCQIHEPKSNLTGWVKRQNTLPFPDNQPVMVPPGGPVPGLASSSQQSLGLFQLPGHSRAAQLPETIVAEPGPQATLRSARISDAARGSSGPVEPPVDGARRRHSGARIQAILDAALGVARTAPVPCATVPTVPPPGERSFPAGQRGFSPARRSGERAAPEPDSKATTGRAVVPCATVPTVPPPGVRRVRSFPAGQRGFSPAMRSGERAAPEPDSKADPLATGDQDEPPPARGRTPLQRRLGGRRAPLPGVTPANDPADAPASTMDVKGKGKAEGKGKGKARARTKSGVKAFHWASRPPPGFN